MAALTRFGQLLLAAAIVEGLAVASLGVAAGTAAAVLAAAALLVPLRIASKW
jgi:hypothetical protein